MGQISNQVLKDIVELDGQHYLVMSSFKMIFERGYKTDVKACDAYGNILLFTPRICEVEHECTFEAVEKGHEEIVSDLARYIADYKAKQDEEKRKREEEQKKASYTVHKMFDTFHSTFTTSYSHTYRDEQCATISDLINAVIRSSWTHSPEED